MVTTPVFVSVIFQPGLTRLTLLGRLSFHWDTGGCPKSRLPFSPSTTTVGAPESRLRQGVQGPEPASPRYSHEPRWKGGDSTTTAFPRRVRPSFRLRLDRDAEGPSRPGPKVCRSESHDREYPECPPVSTRFRRGSVSPKATRNTVTGTSGTHKNRTLFRVSESD